LDPLALLILENKIVKGDDVLVTCEDDEAATASVKYEDLVAGRTQILASGTSTPGPLVTSNGCGNVPTLKFWMKKSSEAETD
jgi:hypothetical protein